MLTVAQITDIHLCHEADALRRDRAEARLRETLQAIEALRPRPVAILATGDLTDRGELAAYDRFWAIIRAETDLPVFPALGNHDLRDAFVAASAWPASRTADGFVQYVVDLAPDLRVVVCDSLDEGHHGAGFCEPRAAWLRATLSEQPDRATLVVIHHPPVASGIRWMDPAPDEPWITRLRDALSGRHQVQAVLCGHVHRAFVTRFAGHLVAVSAATDIQLTLDMTPVDRKQADGRDIATCSGSGPRLPGADG